LPFKGFGYLVPSKWGLPILGCVWDSSVFPQQNRGDQTRLTIMMGGSRHPEVEQMSESELIEYAQRVLREHLGIRADPQEVQIKKAQQAIPQFEVGYARWKREIQEVLHHLVPQLTLSGSGWTGVAINDCIAKARHLAQQVANQML
jgi:oxygen-dependent protoporphyrinogen oxidase